MSRTPAPVVDRSPPPRTLPPPVYTPPPVAAPQVVVPELHTAQANESLGNVALRYNLDYRNLVAFNPQITNPSAPLVAGQLVRLQATAPIVGAPLNTSPVREAERPKPTVMAEPAQPVVPQDGLKREPKAVKVPYSDKALQDLTGRPAANAASNTATFTPPPQTNLPPAVAPVVTPVAPTPPSTTPPTAANAARLPEEGEIKDWGWPVEGRSKITGNFNEASAMKGVDIAGKSGQGVLAAASGRVIFAGPFRGYGNMVIIKHNNTFNSVYAHNSKILVSEGQTVNKGTKIAEMGQSDADSTKLHFEIRRSGKSVDPAKLLPAN